MTEEMKQAVTPDNTANKSDSPQAESKGFYYSVLTEEEKLEYDRAVEVDCLYDEIVLLRVKTKAMAKREPQNLIMIMRAIICLERLVRTQFRLRKNDKGDFGGRMRKVIESFRLPPDILSGLANKALGDT